jgi:hypothetical protein
MRKILCTVLLVFGLATLFVAVPGAQPAAAENGYCLRAYPPFSPPPGNPFNPFYYPVIVNHEAQFTLCTTFGIFRCRIPLSELLNPPEDPEGDPLVGFEGGKLFVNYDYAIDLLVYPVGPTVKYSLCVAIP